MEASVNKKSGYNVPNLERALAVMEMLSEHPEGLTRTELAEALEIPSNSAYRISMSLMENGYITRREGSKKFFLGDKPIQQENNWQKDRKAQRIE